MHGRFGAPTRSTPPLPSLQRPRHRRLRLIVLLTSLTLALFVGGAGFYYRRLPSATDAELRIHQQLRDQGGVDTGLPVPANVGKSVIAIEDHRFYSHHGIDTVGIVRALSADIGGGLPQGGDTITEQLAKVLYGGDDDRSIGAKLRVISLAVKLEHRYTKAEILEMYLNAIYYGDGQFGVAQAGQAYFGKPASSLDWAEASLLAGLPQAPTAYDPLQHFDLARQRQQQVLDALVRTGVLHRDQADAAYAELRSLQN